MRPFVCYSDLRNERRFDNDLNKLLVRHLSKTKDHWYLPPFQTDEQRAKKFACLYIMLAPPLLGLHKDIKSIEVTHTYMDVTWVPDYYRDIEPHDDRVRMTKPVVD